MKLFRSILIKLCVAVFVLQVPNVAAQQFRNPDGRYFPLDQSTPAGIASQWHSLSAGTTIGSPQAVRVNVVGGATISFYDSSQAALETQPSPAQAKLAVGHSYRLRISGLPKLPGVDLFPTLEILDQLHPPPGMEDRYPVPITITKDELEAAAAGRMVTKVIYLEAPRRALGARRSLEEATTNMPNTINLFAEADRLGRPMAILRIGSRSPTPGNPNYNFFGSGGPVMPSALYHMPDHTARTAPGRVRLGSVRPASFVRP